MQSQTKGCTNIMLPKLFFLEDEFVAPLTVYC